MAKLLAGFTLGSVVTAIGFFVLFADLEQKPVPAAAGVGEPATMTEHETERPNSASSTSINRADPIMEVDGSREAQLQNLIDSSQAEVEAYRRELRVLQADRFRQEQPMVSPLYLPPEFAWVADSDYLTPHDQIQRENRDAVWAANVETELQNYFAERPEVVRSFGYPIIECRTSRCAVAFSLHGVEEDTATINQRFNAMVSDFTEQEWPDEFPDTPALYDNRQGDVHTLYWSLTDMRRELEVRRSQAQ